MKLSFKDFKALYPDYACLTYWVKYNWLGWTPPTPEPKGEISSASGTLPINGSVWLNKKGNCIIEFEFSTPDLTQSKFVFTNYSTNYGLKQDAGKLKLVSSTTKTVVNSLEENKFYKVKVILGASSVAVGIDGETPVEVTTAWNNFNFAGSMLKMGNFTYKGVTEYDASMVKVADWTPVETENGAGWTDGTTTLDGVGWTYIDE